MNIITQEPQCLGHTSCPAVVLLPQPLLSPLCLVCKINSQFENLNLEGQINGEYQKLSFL
jgi:hypothetical protein